MNGAEWPPSAFAGLKGISRYYAQLWRILPLLQCPNMSRGKNYRILDLRPFLTISTFKTILQK